MDISNCYKLFIVRFIIENSAIFRILANSMTNKIFASKVYYMNYSISPNNELVSTWLYIKFRIISLYKSYLNPTTVFEFVGTFLISMSLLFQQIRAQK